MKKGQKEDTSNRMRVMLLKMRVKKKDFHFLSPSSILITLIFFTRYHSSSPDPSPPSSFLLAAYGYESLLLTTPSRTTTTTTPTTRSIPMSGFFPLSFNSRTHAPQVPTLPRRVTAVLVVVVVFVLD